MTIANGLPKGEFLYVFALLTEDHIMLILCIFNTQVFLLGLCYFRSLELYFLKVEIAQMYLYGWKTDFSFIS